MKEKVQEKGKERIGRERKRKWNETGKDFARKRKEKGNGSGSEKMKKKEKVRENEKKESITTSIPFPGK